MTDRRLHPATRRRAHVSLRGLVAAEEFTDGTPLRVCVPLVDLLAAPQGPRDRQLWLGDGFLVIDRDQGQAFGRADKDGSCGWLPESALADSPAPTHHVITPGTHLYPESRVQSPETAALPMGAGLTVLAMTESWAETTLGFVPARHLAPIGIWAADPVSVAETLLGSPYLWGGNSRAGIDCSGLVQLARLACGLPCLADSDQQQSLGAALSETEPLRRGDLLFWRGHVAMIVDPTRLIHANGHTMSVAYEPIVECIARIAAQSGGPVTHRRRP